MPLLKGGKSRLPLLEPARYPGAPVGQRGVPIPPVAPPDPQQGLQKLRSTWRDFFCGEKGESQWKAEEAVRSWILGSPAGLAMIASGFTWKPYPHCQLLNKYLWLVAAGQIKQLIVEMPPQHGKSMLTSHYFTAWHLMTFPEQSIMLGSYETKFARLWGRRARDVMELFGEEFFGVRVDPSSRAAESWRLKFAGNPGERGATPGEMHTAGAGGPLTGRGGTLGIVDDIFKNDKEAMSEAIRDNKWEWFKATFMSRIREGGGVALVNTRWHLDDVAGRLQKLSASDAIGNWVVLRIPAFAYDPSQLPPDLAKDYKGDPLATLNPPYIRNPGDPLCPWLFSKKNLLAKMALMGDFWWNSLYQQTPIALEGGIYKHSWIRAYRDYSDLPVPMQFVREGIDHGNWAPVRTLMAKSKISVEELPFLKDFNLFGRWVRTNAILDWDRVILSVDSALSQDVKSKKNSWIVMQVWSAKGSQRYLLDQIRFQGAQYAKVAFLCMCLKWPMIGAKLVENKANGPEIIRAFSALIPGIIPINPEEKGGSKASRALGCTWIWQAGNVHIPHVLLCPWVEAFISELCSFPLGSNDDQVDAQSQALEHLSPMGGGGGGPIGITSSDLNALDSFLRHR